MSISLRRGAFVCTAAVGAVALVAIVTNDAGAQAGAPLQVSPTQGPEGTAVSVSGSGCIPPPVVGGATVEIEFRDEDEVTIPPQFEAMPNELGEWTTTIVAPDPPDDSFDGEVLSIVAVCQIDDVLSFEYAPASFSVMGPGQNTTSTSGPTTSETTPTTPTSPTTAPPGGGGGQTTTTAGPGAPTTTAPSAPSGPTPPPANGSPAVPAEPDHTG